MTDALLSGWRRAAQNTSMQCSLITETKEKKFLALTYNRLSTCRVLVCMDQDCGEHWCVVAVTNHHGVVFDVDADAVVLLEMQDAGQAHHLVVIPILAVLRVSIAHRPAVQDALLVDLEIDPCRSPGNAGVPGLGRHGEGDEVGAAVRRAEQSAACIVAAPILDVLQPATNSKVPTMSVFQPFKHSV